jgi:hypothetical protein
MLCRDNSRLSRLSVSDYHWSEPVRGGSNGHRSHAGLYLSAKNSAGLWQIGQNLLILFALPQVCPGILLAHPFSDGGAAGELAVGLLGGARIRGPPTVNPDFRPSNMPSAVISIVSRVNALKTRQKRVDFVASVNRKFNRAGDKQAKKVD